MNNKEMYHFGVKGMRWGHRKRRQNYATVPNNVYRSQNSENTSRKKNKTIKDMSINDIKKTQNVLRATRKLNAELKKNNNQSPKQGKRMNLDNMTDQELRQLINREKLEREYNEVFNTKQVSRGRQYVNDRLDRYDRILATGTTALGVALAVKEFSRVSR